MAVGNGTRRHGVVINDTPEIRARFRERLEEAGDRGTTDRFTVEADRLLAHVEDATPDLLILDLIVQDGGRGW